jgi:CRP-like cAMP-binding protein
MFDTFRKYVESKATLAESDFARIEAAARPRKLRKRQFLLQAGEVWHYNAFVCSGFLRSYFLDGKGHEHIMTFAPENHWIGDRESLATGLPSKYNIDAIEASEVLLFRKADFDALCQAIPPFNDMVNAILQKSFVVAQERIHVNITYTAQEKYHNFVTRFPSIANRVPQHMIASYLGITPETLTRVRRDATRK